MLIVYQNFNQSWSEPAALLQILIPSSRGRTMHDCSHARSKPRSSLLTTGQAPLRGFVDRTDSVRGPESSERQEQTYPNGLAIPWLTTIGSYNSN